jgi:hypothetical protein
MDQRLKDMAFSTRATARFMAAYRGRIFFALASSRAKRVLLRTLF